MNSSIFILLIAISIPVNCINIDKVKQGWKKQSFKILNGTPAKNGEFPFMVSIQQSNKHLCGGNIINENTIVTAAHCTLYNDPSIWTAVAGVTDLTNYPPDAQTVSISTVIIHPEFLQYSSLYDIAIGKVTPSFIFTPKVNSIKLPSSSNLPGKGEIIGWGSTSYGGPFSNILLKTSVTLKSEEACEEEFGDDTYGLICTTSYPGDSCTRDSGGPLICNSNELCGIISSGAGCGNELEFALYVKVSHVVDWIQNPQNDQNTSIEKLQCLDI